MSKYQIKKIVKDSLFFDKYTYNCKFYLPECSSLRAPTHEEIDRILNWRKNHNRNYGGSWFGSTHAITDTVIARCHAVYDMITNFNDTCLRIYTNTGHLYTNDFDNIQQLDESNTVTLMEIKQAVDDLPPNSMYIKNAKHDYRTYFSSQKISLENKSNLEKFVKAQGNIRLSPGLDDWFNRFPTYTFVADNYFIDHNDDGILTFLNLVCPMKIKRTVRLISDK